MLTCASCANLRLENEFALSGGKRQDVCRHCVHRSRKGSHSTRLHVAHTPVRVDNASNTTSESQQEHIVASARDANSQNASPMMSCPTPCPDRHTEHPLLSPPLTTPRHRHEAHVSPSANGGQAACSQTRKRPFVQDDGTSADTSSKNMRTAVPWGLTTSSHGRNCATDANICEYGHAFEPRMACASGTAPIELPLNVLLMLPVSELSTSYESQLQPLEAQLLQTFVMLLKYRLGPADARARV